MTGREWSPRVSGLTNRYSSLSGWEVILLGIFVLGGNVVTALVFSVLWAWFVVPLGVVSISIWHMMGLLTLWESLTYHLRKDEGKRAFRDLLVEKVIGEKLLGPIFLLAALYPIHCLMTGVWPWTK